jgi:hypothetical protein
MKDKLLQTVLNKNTHKLGEDIITKVISGGQTGADILGVQLAKEAGLPTGGTLSYGPNGKILTEFDDGIDRTQFGFDILPYPGNIRDAYVNRTNLNAANADGTLYFRGPEQGRGLIATRRAASQAGKPFLDQPQTANDIINWALQNDVKTLNIAGNRGSTFPVNAKQNMTNTLQDLFNKLDAEVGTQTVLGDLLSTTDPYVIQQVNTKGVMGAGLANQIRQDLSNQDYAKYQNYSNQYGANLLGKTLPLKSVSHPERTYLNIFGQSEIGRDPNKVYTDYDALKQAFTSLAEKFPAGTKMSMPYGMGAGLANGDWDLIEQLVDEILGSKLNITKWKK